MRFLLIITIFGLFTACSTELERSEAPADLIPKAKMIVVIREMVKLESFIDSRYTQVGVYHKLMVTSGDSLLKAHKVDRTQFESSFSYYGNRQDEMKEMYEQVLEDLNEELGRLESESN